MSEKCHNCKSFIKYKSAAYDGRCVNPKSKYDHEPVDSDFYCDSWLPRDVAQYIVDSSARFREAMRLVFTLRARAEKAERELAERDAYIERLIEAGNTLVSEAFEYEGSVSPKNIISLRDLIAEWRKEREG